MTREVVPLTGGASSDFDGQADGKTHAAGRHLESAPRQNTAGPHDAHGEQREAGPKRQERSARLERQQLPRGRPRLLGKDHERPPGLQELQRRLDSRDAAGPVSAVHRHEASHADGPAQDRHAEDAPLRQEANRQRKARQKNQDVAVALVVGGDDEGAAAFQALPMQDRNANAREEEDRAGPAACKSEEPFSPGRYERRDDGGKAEKDRREDDTDPDGGRGMRAQGFHVYPPPTFTRNESEHTIGGFS